MRPERRPYYKKQKKGADFTRPPSHRQFYFQRNYRLSFPSFCVNLFFRRKQNRNRSAYNDDGRYNHHASCGDKIKRTNNHRAESRQNKSRKYERSDNHKNDKRIKQLFHFFYVFISQRIRKRMKITPLFAVSFSIV